jgi:O-acetyl-ADP-ribose deacetylase (regulator of RNase III)
VVGPLIVTSGDNAAELLRHGGLGNVIGWKDSPAVGPSPHLDPAAYKALRAQYRGINNVAAFQDLDLLPAADHVVLVVDACPYDTGILVRLVEYLHPRVKRLQVLVVEAPPAQAAGYLPVGASLAVPTGHARIPFLIVAPTMHTPEEVPSANCYRAMRAILRLVDSEPRLRDEVFCPGLATGTGRVPPSEAAAEILRAFRDWRHKRGT